MGGLGPFLAGVCSILRTAIAKHTQSADKACSTGFNFFLQSSQKRQTNIYQSVTNEMQRDMQSADCKDHEPAARAVRPLVTECRFNGVFCRSRNKMGVQKGA